MKTLDTTINTAIDAAIELWHWAMTLQLAALVPSPVATQR